MTFTALKCSYTILLSENETCSSDKEDLSPLSHQRLLEFFISGSLFTWVKSLAFRLADDAWLRAKRS